MKNLKFALTIFSLFGLFSNAYASNCPNISGKFLTLESTPQYQQYDEFQQTGCTEILLRGCSIENGSPFCSDFDVKWDLVTGQAILDGGIETGRTVTFTPTSIKIHDNGTPSTHNTAAHGVCTVSNDFSFSLDANNNLVFTNTFTNCADGFNGDINDIEVRL